MFPAAEGPFELRAAIDDLEKSPRSDRPALLREIAPRLRERWEAIATRSDDEDVLRAIAEDLFRLGSVEVEESTRIATVAAGEYSSRVDRGTNQRRASDFALASRHALTAPVLLGAAQRALEEARCVLLSRTPDDRFEPVTSDGDPVLCRFGDLLVGARASALAMCEAIHLLAATRGSATGFVADRAIAACAAAQHSARCTLRATLLGALELASASSRARESPFASWVVETLRWSTAPPFGGALPCAAAREFLRFAR